MPQSPPVQSPPARIPITGATRLYAVLGDPVVQVGSPVMMNAFMRERGIDGVLVPMHVPPPALATVLRALAAMPNCGGACITVPHKLEAAGHCDEVSPAARIAGAVSVVRFADGRILGDNFDGRGFTAGLEGEGITIKGKRIMLIGAGGAARGIAVALGEAGARALTVANRTRSRADEIVKMLAESLPGFKAEALDYAAAASALGAADIIVNATSLGINHGDSLPVALEEAQPDAVVADVIPGARAAATPFLEAGRARGLRVHAGNHMLEYQRDLLARFLGMAGQ